MLRTVRVPGCQKLQITAVLNTVWHRTLDSYTHMATVGVKGLTVYSQNIADIQLITAIQTLQFQYYFITYSTPLVTCGS